MSPEACVDYTCNTLSCLSGSATVDIPDVSHIFEIYFSRFRLSMSRILVQIVNNI